MLLRTVVLPSALIVDSNDSPAFQAVLCGAMLQVLRDICDSAVILTDEIILKPSLHQAVRTWPPKFRKYGQELLAWMTNRHRFVIVPVSRIIAGCAQDACRSALAVVAAGQPDAVFKGLVCATCPNATSASLAPAEVIEIREYSLSRFESAKREIRVLICGDGEFDEQRFKQRVLVPALAYAKHVKVIDRYIGRSIDAGKVWNNTIPPASLTAEYRLSLLWLIDTYAALSQGRSERSLEVYCGITLNDAGERAAAVRALMEFEAELQRQYGSWLRVYVKDETGTPKMPHARYLITDQIALLIERGFDLLWSDEEMRKAGYVLTRDPRRVRDVTVVHCPDARAVETAVRSLNDLK